MKTIPALASFIVAASVATVQAQSYSAADLARRAVERRAVETMIWGMPAVNFDLMLQVFLAAKGSPNRVAYWSRPVNWKNQTLTPNGCDGKIPNCIPIVKGPTRCGCTGQGRKS